MKPIMATAIVIARGGSQRLPNKNMMLFHGQPLVVHKIMQLKKCENVARVFVGSDSPDILAAAREAGAEVRVRAPEYCDEQSRTWNEVIADMALRVPGDTVLWAHCTNPCITSSTYDRALARYRQVVEEESGDSLVSVTPVHGHAWVRAGSDFYPVNYDPWGRSHVVAAGVEPVFFQNGGIFVYSRAGMIRDKYVFGKRPVLFPLERPECIDIDTEADFQDAVAAWDWTRT